MLPRLLKDFTEINMAEIIQDLPLIALKDRVIFPRTVLSLDLGREKSVKAANAANGGFVVFVAQKNSQERDYTPDSVYRIGTVAKIRVASIINNNSVRIEIVGLARARITSIFEEDGYFRASVERMPLICTDEVMAEAYFRSLKALVFSASSVSDRLSKNTYQDLDKIADKEELVYRTAQRLFLSIDKEQVILEREKLEEVYRLVEYYVNNEIEIARLERKISATVKQNIDKNQKEYYLREQLKAIHAELGDDEDEKERLKQQILDKHMPSEIEEKALKELSRMGKMATSSPDYNVLRTYIDWLCDLPWGVITEDTPKLSDAVEILNADHYGLDKVKERITEYLAVLKLTDGLNAPILCLVGPPGVGKTSIAQSVARSLGRKFVRMSLGGVKDESEVRGHRKTYVGAMPGRIINGIKTAGSQNPVFLLDEVDKLSSDMRGDPASALLEVLDPAQNSTFRDRYLEVPFDLSKVLFITTANSLDTIPAPLRDRMEILTLEGYTQEEKLEIAKRYLIPKRREANGLTEEDIEIDDVCITTVISGYTLEAGVRNLERKIDALCRKVAVKKASGEFIKNVITPENLQDFLGSKRYEKDYTADCDEVGAATGLAWTAVGGTTLTIEVSAMQGKGDILLTGKLGDVMKESARAAISYIRSKSDEYGIQSTAFETTDIHVHVPEGATPKDGPSAGITMATAILSAFTGKPVRHNVAMTGEITLRGRVLPIGGLKEKALAAYRIGIKDVIIPEENKKDLEDIPEQVRSKLNFIPVSTVDNVFKTAIVGLHNA